MQIRTDLAVEAREMYCSKQTQKKDIDGIVSCQEMIGDALVTTIEIQTPEGADKLNKPIGKYVTVESIGLKTLDPELTDDFAYILKEQILKLVSLKKDDTVLVVGLGNRNITPDALGPKVVSGIMVTKHIADYAPELLDDDLRSVCAVSPGVMGITGIETKELVLGVVKRIKPSLVIAVDALASGNPDRISTTVQITDTGITPGAGIGNKRDGLNFETLGVPVVAIGVPTVIDAISVALITIKKMKDKMSEEERKIIDNLSYTENEIDNLIVTPKEIDNIINHISKVISNGINLALHTNVDLKYIESFIF